MLQKGTAVLQRFRRKKLHSSKSTAVLQRLKRTKLYSSTPSAPSPLTVPHMQSTCFREHRSAWCTTIDLKPMSQNGRGSRCVWEFFVKTRALHCNNGASRAVWSTQEQQCFRTSHLLHRNIWSRALSPPMSSKVSEQVVDFTTAK